MPNVILLIADQHNAKVSTAYGHPFIHTPNMQRLAERGTVYESAYCASPLCVPSRSAFMSGRWPHETEIFNNCKVFEHDYPSYGAVLAEQGVHAAWIGGAANLYRDPFDLGFSEMHSVKRRPKSMSKDFCRSPVPVREGGAPKTPCGPKPDARAREVRDIGKAIEWLETTGKTLDVPWTLTITIQAPHPPFEAPVDLWEMYEDLADLPELGPEEESANHPYAQDLRRYQRADELTEEKIRRMRQGYYALVTHVDRQIGRLVDAWERLGLAENTVLAYTSDHGEMLGKFGMWFKSSLYEDSVRVPLLVAGPGFGAGKRVQTPVSLLDLQAGIFRAVGADRPAEWAGEPLQDVQDGDKERAVFAEYHAHGVRSGAFMIRQGDWKLIYNMAAPHQLYNLQTDPEERVNVYSSEPEIAAKLEAELRKVCDPEEVNARAHAREARQLAEIEDILNDPDGEKCMVWA